LKLKGKAEEGKKWAIKAFEEMSDEEISEL